MAKLYFKYGAMGSSKSANALMAEYNYAERGKKVLLAKSQIDTREGRKRIRSRIGLEHDCIYLEELLNEEVCKALLVIRESPYSEEAMRWKSRLCENQLHCDAIIVDEAQFATVEQIDFLSDIVDFLDIPVLCYGLRTDFQNVAFPGSLRLLEIADLMEEIKTVCWCGRKATCNARYNEHGIVRHGEQIEIGANDKYVALCRKHLKEGRLHP
ncbi:MAG: thymidine kinase [Lachnospiraceae bacterium]|nr:thymidine kinase [Lachnospiraceae bacterium]